MSAEPTRDDVVDLPAGGGEAWREIDQVVEELAELSASAESTTEFHTQVLDRVVTTLAAVGGAVWMRGTDGPPQLVYQINIAAVGGVEDPGRRGQHEQIALAALQAEQPVLVPPGSSASDDGIPSNPSDLLLVLCSWEGDQTTRGVLEVFQRPRTSPAAQRGYTQFLQVVCQIVSDFHRNRQLVNLHRMKEKWGRFERFSESIHHSLDLKETAYHIANEARQYLECDRVWVAVSKGRRCRAVAVSGVDTVNRRANVVRALERLCGAVVTAGEPLWHDGSREGLPPEIEDPLRAYVDSAHVRSVVVVPLVGPQPQEKKRPQTPLGALVMERFFTDTDARFQADVKAVCNHSQLALANALALRSIPLARVLRQVGRVRWFFTASRLPLVILALLVIAAAVAALALVQTDFEISARGQLQPIARRHVFAPEDGVVSALRVEHDQEVEKDDVLMVLSKPELDIEFNRIWGELQTARKRLAAIEAERLQNPRDTAQQRRKHNQLTAEKEEIGQLVSSLERQYEVAQQQQSQMEVRSPIKGRIVSWNLTKRLKARPVARGQELLTVADLHGKWELELRVPDRRTAHVLAARKKIRQDLDVSFILAMDPREPHVGKLQEVGMRTEVAELDGAFVPVRVDIVDQEDLPSLMPGATARAKIHCGRRAIGYVWLREVIEAFQTWVAF